MAIDPSIALQVKPVEVPDQMNTLAKFMTVENAQNQNQLAQYSLKKAQRTDQQMNSLMSAIQGGLDLSTPEGQRQAYGIAPEVAPQLIQTQLGNMKTVAETKKFGAQGDEAGAKAAQAHVGMYRDQLASVSTPEQAAGWLKAQYADPVVGKVLGQVAPVDQAVASIPTDPQAFNDWKNKQALGMQKYIELNAPKTTVVNAGGSSQVLQTPGLGGAPQTVAQVQHTVSPDAVLSSQTSRANNRDTIAAENLRMGVTPGGGLDDNSERTAQAIANGQLPAPTGMALLNPKNQRILGRVMEINPKYDFTDVTAKKAAATAFTSGPLGNALRSVSTANAHLDQLGELVDAMGNGNVQVVNRVANTFAAQTGNPAPTNFDAVKNVIGQEVVKAIVAGGGSAGERDEAAKIFSNAASPAQLKGAIQHYRMIMGAQAQNLLAQRRAAGLPDSTLPNYNAAPAAAPGAAPGAAPAGWGIQRVN